MRTAPRRARLRSRRLSGSSSLAWRSTASASCTRWHSGEHVHRAAPPAAALRAQALSPPPARRSPRAGGQDVPAGRRAPPAHRFSGSPSRCDLEPCQQRLLRACSASRRRPDAVHIPTSVATGAAPRRMPIQRAAFHRSAAARGPGCPTPRRVGAMPQHRNSRSRAVSPSPRMINRPASPSSAASRRGLIVQYPAIGLFGILPPSRRREKLPPVAKAGSSQSGKSPFQTLPSVAGRAWIAGLLLGQRQVQQGRR